MPLYSAAQADRSRYTNQMLRQKAQEGERAETRRQSTEGLFQKARQEGGDLRESMTEGAMSFEQLQEIKKAFGEMDEYGQKRFKKSTEAMRGVAELLIQKDFEFEKSGMPEPQRQAAMQEIYAETMSNLVDRGLVDPNDVSEQYDRYEMGINLKNADRIRKGVYGTEIRHTGAGRTSGLVTWKDAWRAVKKQWVDTSGSPEEIERFIDEAIPFKYRKRARREFLKEQKKTTKRKQPVF